VFSTTSLPTFRSKTIPLLVWVTILTVFPCKWFGWAFIRFAFFRTKKVWTIHKSSIYNSQSISYEIKWV